MEFYTQHTNIPPIRTSPSGNMYETEYREQLNDDGKLELAKVGRINIYEKIQADLENVNIYNILHAVAMGDYSALKQREASYVDCTEMPKNLMEAQNMVLKAKAEFYNLPLEVRKEFDNSPEMYISEMGTEEFRNKVKPYADKMEALKETANKKEYEQAVLNQASFEKAVEKAKEATENGQK